MKLTSIQYDALMMAIDNAKSDQDLFETILEYNEAPAGYTPDTLHQALEEAEVIIMKAVNPF